MVKISPRSRAYSVAIVCLTLFPVVGCQHISMRNPVRASLGPSNPSRHSSPSSGGYEIPDPVEATTVPAPGPTAVPTPAPAVIPRSRAPGLPVPVKPAQDPEPYAPTTELPAPSVPQIQQSPSTLPPPPGDAINLRSGWRRDKTLPTTTPAPQMVRRNIAPASLPIDQSMPEQPIDSRPSTYSATKSDLGRPQPLARLQSGTDESMPIRRSSSRLMEPAIPSRTSSSTLLPPGS